MTEEFDFTCADCQFDTDLGHEYYFIHRDLWVRYGAGKQMLCIGCLEKRFGRPLCRADFAQRFLDIEEGRTYLRPLKISQRLQECISR